MSSGGISPPLLGFLLTFLFLVDSSAQGQGEPEKVRDRGGSSGFRSPNTSGGMPGRLEFLTRMDVNSDGVLSPDEMQGPARFFVQRLAPSADLSRPIRISDLRQAFEEPRPGNSLPGGPGRERQFDERDNMQSREEDRRQRNEWLLPSETDPLVRGFGVTVQREPVSEFGIAAQKSSVVITNRDREETNRLFQQLDTNRNNQLDQSELALRRWSGDPFEFDQNSDGILAPHELTQYVVKRRTRAESTPPLNQLDAANQREMSRRGSSDQRDFDSSNRADGYTGKMNDAGQRTSGNGPGKSDRAQVPSKSNGKLESYRAKSPYERESFPKGLPIWFKERDRDLDGQLFMSEFMPSWNDESRAAFRSFDANEDGVMTAKECASAAVRGIALPQKFFDSPTLASSQSSLPTSVDTGSTHSGQSTVTTSTPAQPESTPLAPTVPTAIPPSYKTYAVAVLARYDADKNGILSTSESVKVSKDASTADSDGNGEITTDELAWWYVKKR